MKIKQLIKKSISQKTLFTDEIGYSLTKTGFADKYLAGQLTMYKSYSWLKKHFENDLKQIKNRIVTWRRNKFGSVGCREWRTHLKLFRIAMHLSVTG